VGQSQDYRKRADECERLAANPRTFENRRTLLYLAGRWRALADEEETQARTERRESRPVLPSK